MTGGMRGVINDNLNMINVLNGQLYEYNTQL